MRTRRVIRTILATLLIVAGTLGGMVLGLAVGSTQQQHTSVGTIRTSVRADLDGHVIVYVPLVDWRVRLLDHHAPMTITIELRGIDRDSATTGVSSASAAARSLQDVRADTTRVIERAVRRAMLVAAIGGVVGGLVAGGVLAGLLLPRRWLLLAPVLATVTVAGVLAASLQAIKGIDEQHLEVVAAGGHANELPVVLRFAEQLLDVGDEYEGHYRTALASIDNVAAFADRGDGAQASRQMLLMSDLHDNVFVLSALERFVGEHTTVFAAGDFVQVGAQIEQATARRVAHLGDRVIAVSGNHDTPEYMAALADAGADVLDDEQPLIEVDGLRVAGMSDPLERDEDSTGEHRLRVYGEEYDRERDAVIDWWDSLDERPDVVLIHQHGFAHHLARVLDERGDEEPLVILTGHDHELHVHAKGPHVIVDGGTVGAGGIVAVGEQPATFAQLSFSGRRIVAVTLVSIEPLTGRASSERIPIRSN